MKTVFAALAGVVLAAGSAQAAPIVQAQNFGPATPNFNQTLTFNQYNGLLADLVSVHIKVDLNINGGRLELDNDGLDPAAGTADLGASVSISSGDVALVDALLQPVVGSVDASNSSLFALGSNDGDPTTGFDAGGTDYFDFIGSPASDTDNGFIGSLAFAGYVGAGTFDINAVINQIINYGAIGGISFAGTPVTASGTVTVTYEIIPAPGAAGLIGLGGLVALRRRR